MISKTNSAAQMINTTDNTNQKGQASSASSLYNADGLQALIANVTKVSSAPSAANDNLTAKEQRKEIYELLEKHGVPGLSMPARINGEEWVFTLNPNGGITGVKKGIGKW